MSCIPCKAQRISDRSEDARKRRLQAFQDTVQEWIYARKRRNSLLERKWTAAARAVHEASLVAAGGRGSCLVFYGPGDLLCYGNHDDLPPRPTSAEFNDNYWISL